MKYMKTHRQPKTRAGTMWADFHIYQDFEHVALAVLWTIYYELFRYILLIRLLFAIHCYALFVG